MEMCPSCLVVAEAYHEAFLQVGRHITMDFVMSYYDCFRFFSTSTPSDKAEWINSFTQNFDRDVFFYRTHAFFESMKDLLKFHCLILLYDFETESFTCQYNTLE
jgi:hypothetical protein